MPITETAKTDKSKYALLPDGRINYEAYKGLDGAIEENGLTVDVRIVDARRRYGHLDLLVVPKAGSGERWMERKNVALNNDPASPAPVSFGIGGVLTYSK